VVGAALGAVAIATGILARRAHRRAEKGLQLHESYLAELRERAWRQDRGIEGEASGEMLQLLRLRFVSLVEGWSSSNRDELVFLLFDRFVDIPADIAQRLGEQTATQLCHHAQEARDIGEWAATVGLLDAEDRRVLFDQIRRATSR